MLLSTTSCGVVISKQKNILGLAAWVAVVFVAAAVGGIASIEAKVFYGQLIQPGWAPPPWLFGPVWTILYTMMAVAAWQVWLAGGFRNNQTAFALFFVQLVLNSLWSWLFFVWKLGQLAFFEVLLLWVFILAVIISFWRVRAIAGGLLVPYLLWVSFAAFLNLVLWRSNPQVLG
jgi:tryptophan-rich sensory protein